MIEAFKVLQLNSDESSYPPLDVVLEEDWDPDGSEAPSVTQMTYGIKVVIPIGDGLAIEKELDKRDLSLLARTVVGALSLVAEANLQSRERHLSDLEALRDFESDSSAADSVSTPSREGPSLDGLDESVRQDGTANPVLG